MAGNGTHRTPRISEERLRTQPAHQETPKTYATREQDLCPNCKHVDLDSLLNDEYFDLLHSTLAAAVKSVECTFCQYVAKISKEWYGELGQNEQEMIKCTLNRLGVAFNPQYRKGDRMYYAEIQPWIFLEHQCSSITCGGSTCSKNIHESDMLRDDLDLLSIPPAISSNTSLPTVVRRKLEPKFNCKKLLDWLKESSIDEVQHSSAAQWDAMSLERLIRANRFRVLDMTSSKIVTVPCHVRYIALSYVWGGAQNGFTGPKMNGSHGYASNTGAISAWIDIHRLPWTIQDTIDLARQIGERYLWVDALCITQDDPEDKGTIIPEMGAIYGNAYLTVVAADGFHSNARLSRLVSGEAQEEWMSMVTPKGCIELSRARPTMQTAIRRTSWNSRAWTLQERLLSKRSVLFTEWGVFFDCPAFNASEAYELTYNANGAEALKLTGLDLFESFQLKHTSQYDTYCSLLFEYTSRKLSHSGDRLDALTGVLRQLQPHIASSHHLNALSGLVHEDFVVGLHWSGQGKRPREKNPSSWQTPVQLKKMNRLEMDTRCSRYLPSWSWCGWKDSITLESQFFYPIDRKTPWSQTRRALPKPTTIDAANILCHTLHAPADFQPKLCAVTMPLRVILHLWAKTWPCTLIPKLQQGDNTVYAVEPQRLRSEVERDEDEENEVILPDGVDPGSNFELLSLIDHIQQYILVREVGQFFERVDVVYHPYLYKLRDEFVAKYVRLR